MKDNNVRLQVLAKRLRSVDEHLVHLLARRNRLAQEVAMIKIEDRAELYRPQIEKKRLRAIARSAQQEGVNPEYARAMLYQIIGESCKQQVALMDQFRLRRRAEKFMPTYAELRENLIRLTRAWAPRYDAEYAQGHPATAALQAFEHKIIDRAIAHRPDRDLCLEVGCATGKESRRVANRFRNLVGFDVSPHMIRVGVQQVATHHIPNVNLLVHDMEKTWPVADQSVSMLIMNSGVASDIANLPFVLSEAVRVLKRHGRFVMSFYNKEAWAQRVYFPWPLGLVAGIDQERNCLEVKYKNKLLPIFARPYTLDEIQRQLPRHLCILSTATYPTLLSILPKEIIEATPPTGLVEQLDIQLSSTDHNLGSYIIISGQKV